LEKFEMKKTLVAIAAVVATTGAMAEATITGSIQAGTNQLSTTTSGGSAAKTLTIGDDNGNTVVNFGVSEDLGDGLHFTGNISIETGLLGSTSTALQSHGVNETYAAVTGAFGGIKVGALQTPTFQAAAAGDAGGGLLVNNIVYANNNHQGTTYGTGAGMLAQSFQYTLPKFVDGLTLKYHTALGGESDSTAGSQWLAADYASGAFTAGIANSEYKYSTTATDKTSTVYATYNFGVATVKAMWGTAQTNGYNDVNSTSIGFSVPMGAATLMYSHSSSNGSVYNETSADNRTVVSTNQTGDFLGVSYAFSKRTTAYAVYYKESGNDAGSTKIVDDSSSWNTVKFILIHSF